MCDNNKTKKKKKKKKRGDEILEYDSYNDFHVH